MNKYFLFTIKLALSTFFASAAFAVGQSPEPIILEAGDTAAFATAPVGFL